MDYLTWFDCGYSAGPVRAVGVYPLNGKTKGRDVSLFKNPPGILRRVRPARGPDRKPKGSYKFPGGRNSVIKLPIRRNVARTVTRGISVFAWIKPARVVGPIFTWGFQLALGRRGVLLAG